MQNRFGLRTIGIKQFGFELEWICIRSARAAQMHSEFQLPSHRFDDAGGGNFIAVGIGEQDFYIWTRLKRRHLDVDTHTLAIGIRLSGQRRDVRLFRRHALQVIFGEEKTHGAIITSSYEMVDFVSWM